MSLASGAILNVGLRLTQTARDNPDGVAVAEPLPRRGRGKRRYRRLSFRELDEQTDRIAAGLQQMGARPAMRLVLLVPAGIDFVSAVFAAFKAGVVPVLIDPGVGRDSLIQCLQEIEPDGFVAVPKAHAARRLMRRRFGKARLNVTVGRKWLWGGPTLDRLRRTSLDGYEPAATKAEDPAAIIFTSGSTGPPKGVLYSHGNFDSQVDQIRDRYAIRAGEIDVPGFPLFALFNAAMEVTTVFPDMDFTRPAAAEPAKIIEAVSDWEATQAFGSPALWNVVGRYCEQHDVRLPTLRRVLSAGAAVPLHVLERMKKVIHEEGQVHTPYGATEALPVASISASELLGETARTATADKGTCVGQRFSGIDWKVIGISDDPIERIEEARELPHGQIGELIVRGPVVTRQYVTRWESNALHKMRDGENVWHRMGDVGYLDARDRFWFCGRKSHRVQHARGPMFTEPCESIVNQHERVYRSALVGIGPPGHQIPIMVVETWPEHRPASRRHEQQLLAELWDVVKSHELLREVRDILVHPCLPVDARHNSKIAREQLVDWVRKKLRK